MSYVRPLGTLLLLFLVALPISEQTTNNDSSCDISVTPAATLLLPYFEVNLAQPAHSARTTLFTITNVSPQPQIARATIWTDLAYPLYTFDIFLTGYDVAAVNLRDLLTTGRLPGARGGARPGPLSSFANLNHLSTMPVDCASRPEAIPPATLTDLQSALSVGRTAQESCPIGLNKGRLATGYVSIDVVATCSPLMPTSREYFLAELLFDNVLIGDWMTVQPDRADGNQAVGSPLVHIRAIPEGGRAGTIVPTHLPYTFHDRLTNTLPSHVPRTFDRRQPLPATFSSRFIQGWQPDFQTRLLIWREGVTGGNAECRDYGANTFQEFADVVRFDEHENATVHGRTIQICTPLPYGPSLPPAASVSSVSATFPPLVSPVGDIAGWLYLNLSNSGSRAYSVAPGRDFKTGAAVAAACARQNQNWVVAAFQAEGRYAVAMDATPLANGCSRAPLANAQIGPGTNVTP